MPRSRNRFSIISATSNKWPRNTKTGLKCLFIALIFTIAHFAIMSALALSIYGVPTQLDCFVSTQNRAASNVSSDGWTKVNTPLLVVDGDDLERVVKVGAEWNWSWIIFHTIAIPFIFNFSTSVLLTLHLFTSRVTNRMSIIIGYILVAMMLYVSLGDGLLLNDDWPVRTYSNAVGSYDANKYCVKSTADFEQLKKGVDKRRVLDGCGFFAGVLGLVAMALYVLYAYIAARTNFNNSMQPDETHLMPLHAPPSTPTPYNNQYHNQHNTRSTHRSRLLSPAPTYRTTASDSLPAYSQLPDTSTPRTRHDYGRSANARWSGFARNPSPRPTPGRSVRPTNSSAPGGMYQFLGFDTMWGILRGSSSNTTPRISCSQEAERQILFAPGHQTSIAESDTASRTQAHERARARARTAAALEGLTAPSNLSNTYLPQSTSNTNTNIDLSGYTIPSTPSTSTPTPSSSNPTRDPCLPFFPRHRPISEVLFRAGLHPSQFPPNPYSTRREEGALSGGEEVRAQAETQREAVPAYDGQGYEDEWEDVGVDGEAQRDGQGEGDGEGPPAYQRCG